GSNYGAIVALVRDEDNGIVGGKLEFDEMALVPTVDRKPLGPSDRSRVRERLEALAQEEGEKLKRYGRDNVEQAIDQVAMERPFHPVRDYLMSCLWDGKPRIEALLSAMRVNDTPLSRRLLRGWFVSAVARVLKSGCKVDTVMVLVGRQSFHKS